MVVHATPEEIRTRSKGASLRYVYPPHPFSSSRSLHPHITDFLFRFVSAGRSPLVWTLPGGEFEWRMRTDRKWRAWRRWEWEWGRRGEGWGSGNIFGRIWRGGGRRNGDRRVSSTSCFCDDIDDFLDHALPHDLSVGERWTSARDAARPWSARAKSVESFDDYRK